MTSAKYHVQWIIKMIKFASYLMISAAVLHGVTCCLKMDLTNKFNNLSLQRLVQFRTLRKCHFSHNIIKCSFVCLFVCVCVCVCVRVCVCVCFKDSRQIFFLATCNRKGGQSKRTQLYRECGGCTQISYTIFHGDDVRDRCVLTQRGSVSALCQCVDTEMRLNRFLPSATPH